jgi:hypothetical protein
MRPWKNTGRKTQSPASYLRLSFFPTFLVAVLGGAAGASISRFSETRSEYVAAADWLAVVIFGTVCAGARGSQRSFVKVCTAGRPVNARLSNLSG